MTVNEHIRNVYKKGELIEKSTIRKSLTVQKEGKREVTREITFYNLDVIISVGYRVKSKRGTQFRIWANRILKDYLVKGYAVNEKRLKDTTAKLNELKSAVKLLGSVIHSKEITTEKTAPNGLPIMLL